MGKTGLIIVLLALAGCAAKEDAATAPVIEAADMCGAAALKSLIGKNRSEIPPAEAGKPRRVTCAHCPVTLDYSPARLNIFYDEASGVIKEVKCG